MDAVAGALVAALFVQSALILSGAWFYQRAEASHRAERERLQNLIVARDPREFAMLQKSSRPRTEPAAEESDILPADVTPIGMG